MSVEFLRWSRCILQQQHIHFRLSLTRIRSSLMHKKSFFFFCTSSKVTRLCLHTLHSSSYLTNIMQPCCHGSVILIPRGLLAQSAKYISLNTWIHSIWEIRVLYRLFTFVTIFVACYILSHYASTTYKQKKFLVQGSVLGHQ